MDTTPAQAAQLREGKIWLLQLWKQTTNSEPRCPASSAHWVMLCMRMDWRAQKMMAACQRLCIGHLLLPLLLWSLQVAEAAVSTASH